MHVVLMYDNHARLSFLENRNLLDSCVCVKVVLRWCCCSLVLTSHGVAPTAPIRAGQSEQGPSRPAYDAAHARR